MAKGKIILCSLELVVSHFPILILKAWSFGICGDGSEVDSIPLSSYVGLILNFAKNSILPMARTSFQSSTNRLLNLPPYTSTGRTLDDISFSSLLNVSYLIRSSRREAVQLYLP